MYAGAPHAAIKAESRTGSLLRELDEAGNRRSTVYAKAPRLRCVGDDMDCLKPTFYRSAEQREIMDLIIDEKRVEGPDSRSWVF